MLENGVFTFTSLSAPMNETLLSKFITSNLFLENILYLLLLSNTPTHPTSTANGLSISNSLSNISVFKLNGILETIASHSGTSILKKSPPVSLCV
jgi:hypothetical protein